MENRISNNYNEWETLNLIKLINQRKYREYTAAGRWETGTEAR